MNKEEILNSLSKLNKVYKENPHTKISQVDQLLRYKGKLDTPKITKLFQDVIENEFFYLWQNYGIRV